MFYDCPAAAPRRGSITARRLQSDTGGMPAVTGRPNGQAMGTAWLRIFIGGKLRA
jgi:hypothetical protein